jgi:hypothetical protein
MKKIIPFFWMALLVAVLCSGCATYPIDQYGRVAGPGIATYPAYPIDVYPYYWGGWYYYPHWNGTVWVYNYYNSPQQNWTGPQVRLTGPPPKHWSDCGMKHPVPGSHQGQKGVQGGTTPPWAGGSQGGGHSGGGHGGGQWSAPPQGGTTPPWAGGSHGDGRNRGAHSGTHPSWTNTNRGSRGRSGSW